MAEDSTCPHCGRELTSPVALGQSHSNIVAAGHGLEPAAELGAIEEAGGPRRLLEDPAFGLETVPHVSLRDTEDRDNSAADCSTSAALPAPRDRAGRLRIFGEIAHGGMGRVLRGRDEDLGRELAVKVLREANRDDPELIRRFIEEAGLRASSSTPGSCRSMSWRAGRPPAVLYDEAG